MKKIVILVFLLLVTGCDSKMITYEDTLKLKDYIIVDVREKIEYQKGHIKDAINIPVGKLENSKLKKSKKIIVYCKSGTRSNKAYEILKKMGYNVYDLGSIDNWKEKLVEE